LKLAPLLAEFLYTHRKLDLPGIGSFLLDENVHPDLEQIKAGKETISEGISFQANPGIKEAPELVDFISAATGKIRALASADLDSNLESARQFLNIGKPFLFDGIGSLSKLQNGQYDFKPGAPVIEKANPRARGEQTEQESHNAAVEGFKTIFYAPKVKTNYRKIVFVFLLLAGVGLAIWGGYKMYKNSTSANKETAKAETDPPVETPNENTQTIPANNSTNTQPTNPTDTATQPVTPPVTAPVISTPAGNYKFVVETADKLRGLTRFNKLKGFGLDIKMETRDSLSFKLYFVLPAMAADTSRLLDSLRRLYTPAGNKAYVER
jgi:hypothetical protein